MLRFLRKTIARMGMAGAVFLCLAFAAPAFASHACIDKSCAPSSQTAFEAPSDADDACPDCGPACANGCCHAQHAATAPDLAAPSSPPVVTRTDVWFQDAAPPLALPAGPDRPPRL